jgi:hypothetical protein
MNCGVLKLHDESRGIMSSWKLSAAVVSLKEIKVKRKKEHTKFAFKSFSGRAFSSQQRCRLVFPCSKSIEHTIELCGSASIRGLLLVRYAKGKIYVGKEDNKFLKKCKVSVDEEKAKKDLQEEWSTEILDPIDRGKRLLFILLSTLQELSEDNGNSFERALGESILLIDSYDIPQLSVLPRNSFAFSTVPLYSSALSATLPVTKLEYNITAKGKVIGIRDSAYAQLRDFQGKKFQDREDRMIFSGRVKSTRIGFKDGRKYFERMARNDGNFLIFNNPPISFAKQAKFRYIVSLSGAGAWTFYRVYTFMLGSVVFCQESKQKLWYYEYFHPMIHYIPVKEDLSDLKEKLRWARNNMEAAAEIALAGRTLAIEVFSPRKILNEYKERIANHIFLGGKAPSDATRNVDRQVGCKNKTVSLCEGPTFCNKCVPLK